MGRIAAQLIDIGAACRTQWQRLYCMGARYYAPETGRFTQLDPLACSISSGQRYGYAGGNPVNYVDPAGTSHVSAHYCGVVDYIWGPKYERWGFAYHIDTLCRGACVAAGVALGYAVGYRVAAYLIREFAIKRLGKNSLATITGGGVAAMWDHLTCAGICRRIATYRYWDYGYIPVRGCYWYY